MDSFEWNKIIGAVLGTCIFIFVIKLVADTVYDVPPPAKAGYVVEGVPEAASSASTAPVEEAMPDWGTVLPAANVATGKSISTRCEQCHDTSSAHTIKIGPPLYCVVGRVRASIAGFDYSSAMKAKGGAWTYDELFKFLKSPGAYIPGTKMTFAGLHSAEDRINLIAFLRTNAASPAAIPAPAPAKAVAAPAKAGASTAGAPTSQAPANVQSGKTTSGPTVKNPPATPGK